MPEVFNESVYEIFGGLKKKWPTLTTMAVLNWETFASDLPLDVRAWLPACLRALCVCVSACSSRLCVCVSACLRVCVRLLPATFILSHIRACLARRKNLTVVLTPTPLTPSMPLGGVDLGG
jgi:hypothetical protein